MDLDKIKKDIETAGNEYAKKHMQQPISISIRRDVDEALHHSSLAFLYDFADVAMTRERYMGMDVTVVDGGPEFVITEPKEEP